MCYGVEAVVRKEIDVVYKSPIGMCWGPCLFWKKHCYPSVWAGIVVEVYGALYPSVIIANHGIHGDKGADVGRIGGDADNACAWMSGIFASYPITQFKTVDWMYDWVGKGQECILGAEGGSRIYIASHKVDSRVT